MVEGPNREPRPEPLRRGYLDMSEIEDPTIERDNDEDGPIERVTVIAKEFTPAAMEYHRRRLGEQGYAIEGPIGRHKFMVIEDTGGAVRRRAVLRRDVHTRLRRVVHAGIISAQRPESRLDSREQRKGRPEGRPFACQTAVRRGPRGVASSGADLRRGENPGPCNRRPRLKTIRHWITSFRLLTGCPRMPRKPL